MSADLSYPAAPFSEAAEQLRTEVRAFLAEELAGVPPLVRAKSWNGFDAAFSRKLGARGWIGMTWPTQYGGHARSNAERYVVVEETLASGAPVAAHWIADRQSGPLLLRYGTEAQKQRYLPGMAAGETYTCIGMSEPDVGSDLAAVRTRAEPVEGGFRINGTKLWTTNAHNAQFMLLFCRTSGTPADRHKGTSQILVDLSLPGIDIRPITDLAGERHFNEVVFDDAFVPADALIGAEGNGWEQVMSELAYERSGPERFLSSMALLVEMTRLLGTTPGDAAEAAVGRLVAHLMTLRRMSRGVAAMLENKQDAGLHATIVKDLGALFEQEIPDIARQLIAVAPNAPATREFGKLLAYTVASVPAFSLRGGTREILRGIIARGLGLR
ncbi:acyl-CoA dehydrogenase family protein [Sphingomonas immobilis]|uniref:Acyl-CoA dehydrogenase family protein n=1 Tax=Sphingomonas immobilis TaxID=3063997 RepID=A0ABT9A000_9SPHN|nr:acyl-CoA dehydrogenase family protein [Sphingomonas sp. CA1-15]MDO7843162.1 acyl-CoA dehydrogenase family protein [Sphingomonas sp. CA1-15]